MGRDSAVRENLAGHVAGPAPLLGVLAPAAASALLPELA
jgi:hypothetical protein